MILKLFCCNFFPQYPNERNVTLDVQEVAAQYGVRAMPTFLFIKDGQEVDKVVGADKNELERKCNRYASSR